MTASAPPRVTRNRVRFWRQERGLTQAQLAQQAELTEGQVSRIETGKRPTMLLTTAARIARVLGVSIDDLDLVT